MLLSRRFKSFRFIGETSSYLGRLAITACFIWLFFSSTFPGIAATAVAAGPAPVKKVLVLPSYNFNYPSCQMFLKGVLDELKTAPFDILYYHENLNLFAHMDDPSYLNAMAASLKIKYAHEKIDLIIVQNRHALQFLLQHGQPIFAETPVVFAGRATEDFGKLTLPANITGVVEPFDAQNNLELILRNHPDLKKLYIIVGASASEDPLLTNTLQAGEKYKDRLQFIVLSKLSLNEILKTISSPEPNAAVLYLSMQSDLDGTLIMPAEIARRIGAAAQIPAYGILDSYMASGLVGGYLTTYEGMGHNAAQVGIDILKGKKPADIPVAAKSMSQYYFDWRQLKRWGISESTLPPESKIDFQPPNFWELYKWHILAAAGLIVLQGILITALLLNRRLRRKAQLALKEANELLEHKVAEKTQELTAANQELWAMNEELGSVNTKLEEEVEMRRQAGERLLLRERQYRAATNLVTKPTEETHQYLLAILQNALDLLNAPDGYIGFYDKDANLFSILHAVGVHTLRKQKTFSQNVGLQSEVYESGEAIYIEDYRTYAKRVEDPCLQNVTSLLMLPLRRGSTVYGVFAATWEDVIHPVGQEDIEVMRQFADLASVLLERAQNHDHIHHMAFHDSLTGLPNRANIEKTLAQELTRVHKETSGGALFFVDLDDLKAINDTFGHSSGNRIICEASRHIVEAIGSAGVVARQGGDEFIALLPRLVNREAAAQQAEKVITELGREYDVGGKKLHVTASLGIVFYPEDGVTVEELLKNADSAMYAAKKAGRNCWRFFEQSLSQEAYERLALTNSLRRALEKQELFLQYQPQVDLKSGLVSGFEALLRWRSKEHGLVSPVKFIPIAEESGLILPIGAWVLQQACRFARDMTKRGFGHVHIAVNVSPKQLLVADFVEQVRATLTQEEVAPEQMVLEVTEGIMIESMKESIHKLWELSNMGLGLALDDFGTGYSSLTYLKNLPINILKVDKSFIDGYEKSETQEEMIASIISLGHTLGMSIVAEGVETEVQKEMLKRCSCDCVQGYIFSRPVNEADAVTLLR